MNHLGNNLIEITPLTTLIGAATAESLILASQGAGGLPWAAMSCFGSFFLAKACIAAALPSWLRESAGVDSPHSATILGASSPLDKKSMLKVAPGIPAGISVSLEAEPSITSIYALDKYTSGIVQSRLSFQDDNSQHIFAYTQDGSSAADTYDWIAILLSLIKLVETVVLWSQASWELGIASSASWAFFFISALVLQLLGISREFKHPSTSRLRDVILGEFPTMDAGHEKPNIILGAPINVRTHLAWRLIWAVGAVVSVASTIIIYMILKHATAKQFYLWLSFQCLWLLCRTIFCHFAVVTDGRRHPLVEVEPSRYLGRLLSLCSGVSRHLAQCHPRTPASYASDVHDICDIRPLIIKADCRLDWNQPSKQGDAKLFDSLAASNGTGDLVDIEILAVVGDTMLSSLSWIYGCGMINWDLYDSCLVLLKINDRILIVPSARVLSGNATKAKMQLADAEAGCPPTFIPISGPCRGQDNGWAYWVPIGIDRWLHFIPDDLNFLGKQRAEILDDEEVTRRLMLGTLWVSVKSVDEIKDCVERGAIVARILFSLLEQHGFDTSDDEY